MRGIAALGVVVLHRAGILGRFHASHGHLAVDFFFLLSGFVLTFAYQKRLDSGWPTREFLKVRLVRLYPLYGLAMLMGCVSYAMISTVGMASMWQAQSLSRLGLGLLLVPIFWNRWVLYPLNFPLWSVIFEIVANVVHASVFRRRSWRFVAAFTVAGFLGLCALLFHFRSINYGVRNPHAVWGLVRLLFGYTSGMLLYRVWRSGWVRVKLPSVCVVALLLGVLVIPVPQARIALYELVCVVVVFPVILLLGVSTEPPQVLVGTFRALGVASYAVYVVQEPWYQFLNRVWMLVPGHGELTSSWVSGTLYLGTLMGLALILDRFYDGPVRAWMTQAMTARRPAAMRKKVPPVAA